MEKGNQTFLKITVQIDQQVAATNQIEPREGRILDHVLDGEQSHFPNLFLDSNRLAFSDEESF